MNKLVKRRWVRALRSGKYKQGKGKLRTIDGKFCCLGVLCDLYSKEHPESAFDGIGNFLGEGSYLPPAVRKWAGLDNWNPLVGVNKKKGEYVELATLNDGDTYNRIKRKSFKSIATLISAQL